MNKENFIDSGGFGDVYKIKTLDGKDQRAMKVMKLPN